MCEREGESVCVREYETVYYVNLSGTPTFLAEIWSRFHVASGIDWETRDVWIPLQAKKLQLTHTHSLTHSLIHSLTHSLTYSHTHSLTHSLTLSLSLSYTQFLPSWLTYRPLEMNKETVLVSLSPPTPGRTKSEPPWSQRAGLLGDGV